MDLFLSHVDENQGLESEIWEVLADFEFTKKNLSNNNNNNCVSLLVHDLTLF